MDGQHFDTLARTLASARSRRSLLRTAFGTAIAGLGAAFGSGEAAADTCKAGGKQCKKNSQCCSGICRPPSTSTSTAKSESICCDPVGNDVICAGHCGQQVVNNCGQLITCGLCANQICIEEAECNSGECCEGNCCDENKSPTAACCPGQGECCECFQNNAPGGGNSTYCGCDAPREICGTYPNDSCCQAQDTCVDGHCIPKPVACPPADNPDGPNIDCRFSGCCKGVCCPSGTTCNAAGQCVPALPSCTTGDICTDGAICTASEDSPVGECCPGNRYYEVMTDTDEGLFVSRNCCTLGTEARGCSEDFCTSVTYEGCTSTFRGSQPRVTG